MSQVSDLLNTLFGTILKDEAGVLQPIADNYLSSIVANPAPDNVVAQSLGFEGQVLVALPNVEAAAAKDTAAALKSFLDAQIPALVASAAANPTSAATATPPATPSTTG
jgi:hypothetical protein